jgi:glycerol-3-phosphate acyltransferase PlsY
MLFPLFLLASYLIGSLPFGLWIGLACCKTDLREHGSGNIGATNAWRVLGWKAGLAIFILDMAKGLLPVLEARGITRLPTQYFFSSPNAAPVIFHWTRTGASWLIVGCGLAAILGHSFSPFLRFKGGKGVATSAGVALGMSWKAATAGFLVWALLLATTHYISVGSIIGTPIGAAGIWLDNGRSLPFALFGILATVFVIVKHIPNIKRLMKGTELKMGAKK